MSNEIKTGEEQEKKTNALRIQGLNTIRDALFFEFRGSEEYKNMKTTDQIAEAFLKYVHRAFDSDAKHALEIIARGLDKKVDEITKEDLDLITFSGEGISQKKSQEKIFQNIDSDAAVVAQFADSMGKDVFASLDTNEGAALSDFQQFVHRETGDGGIPVPTDVKALSIFFANNQTKGRERYIDKLVRRTKQKIESIKSTNPKKAERLMNTIQKIGMKSFKGLEEKYEELGYKNVDDHFMKNIMKGVLVTQDGRTDLKDPVATRQYDVVMMFKLTLQEQGEEMIEVFKNKTKIQREVFGGKGLFNLNRKTLDFSEYTTLVGSQEKDRDELRDDYQNFLDEGVPMRKGLTKEFIKKHNTIVQAISSGTIDIADVDHYTKQILSDSIDKIIDRGTHYGADLSLVGGEEVYKKMLTDIFDPEKKIVFFPGGGKVVFDSKKIDLLEVGDEGELWSPKLAVNLYESESIPLPIRNALNLPQYENPLGIKKQNQQGWLTREHDGNTQYYGLKDGDIDWFSSKDSVKPLQYGTNSIDGNPPKRFIEIIGEKEYEYEVDGMTRTGYNETAVKEMTYEEFKENEYSFELDPSDSSVLLSKSSFESKSFGQSMTLLEGLNYLGSAKKCVSYKAHLEEAIKFLSNQSWYEDLSDIHKEGYLQELRTLLEDRYGLESQYDPQELNDITKDFKNKEKYNKYGKTEFIDLTGKVAPNEFADFHSDKEPIPGWIEGDGQMVANKQYFNKYLADQFDQDEKRDVLIDRDTGEVTLAHTKLSISDQELFEQLFNTDGKDEDGLPMKIHRKFPVFTSKGIRTLHNQFEKEKKKKGNVLTPKLIEFLEQTLSAYEKTLDRFEQRKNHESMHRFFMTQSKHQSKIGKSYSGALDEEGYKEILELGLVDVKENPVSITHELLCIIAEGRKSKRVLKDEPLTKNEEKNAERCGGYVVLQSDLSTDGRVVLYDIAKNQESIINTSDLNKQLHTFFGGNIAYEKSGKTHYLEFGEKKDLGSNIPGDAQFDLSRVRQYSLHQAMRSDGIEIAGAANTQGIKPDRVINASGPVDIGEVQRNTSTIYAQPSTVPGANALRGQSNAVVFPVADRRGNIYTGDSLDDEARKGIRNAAQNLGRIARANSGEISIPQDETGKYVLDPGLPEDMKDEIDQEIRRAFAPSTINSETPSTAGRNSGESGGNNEQDESNEQPESFVDKFEKIFFGDKLAKPENGTVIMARRQGSKLQGGGSIRWRGEIVDAGPGSFSIRFDSTTEIGIETETLGPIEGVAGLEQLSNTLKELYKFRLIGSYTDLGGLSSGFDEQDGSQKISEGLGKFDGLGVNGNTFTKEFYDSTNNDKMSTEKVEYRGNLEARDGGDNVLFKVEPYGNKVRVTSEPTDAKGQFGMEHVMDIPTFLMFMADKGFEPYCQEEVDRESVKYPDRGDQSDDIEARGFWDGFVSISAALAAIKKFPEAYKYRFEQQEKFEASLFAKQIAGIIPDSMSFLYANEIKNDLVSEHDDTTFSVINGYKDKISQKDGAGGTHDKVIAKIIEAEVFKNPEPGIRFKHKAAGYLLYAMEKGNPYIRSLSKYADQGMWARVLLGEAKQQQFLREREELYARLKTNGASDDEYDKLAKYEIKFIFEHLTDHPLFGPKYGRTLEDLHDNYSVSDKVDAVKGGVSGKGNFLDMYNAFQGGGMNGFKPSTIMGALEAMEETAEEPIHYNIFYKALMQILMSGIVSFEFDNKMKDRLRNICRRRGIPIGMMCKQIGHPETIMTIVNYIAQKSGKSEMSSELQSMIRSLSPSSFAGEVMEGGKMKPKYKVISGQVAKRRESSQNGATVMDAFNYKNSSLLEGYAEGIPEIEGYFSTGAVFNPVKDYRETAPADGNSPFYNGILNVAPGTFQSQMLISGKTFDKNSRTSQEVRKKFNGGLETFENLIDGAKPGRETEAYITFIRKKFKSYFGDKMGEEYMEYMKKAIDTGNEGYFERLFDQRLLNDEFTENGGSGGSRLVGKELEFSGKTHKPGITEPIYRKGIGIYRKLLRKAFENLPTKERKSFIFSKEPYG